MTDSDTETPSQFRVSVKDLLLILCGDGIVVLRIVTSYMNKDLPDSKKTCTAFATDQENESASESTCTPHTVLCVGSILLVDQHRPSEALDRPHLGLQPSLTEVS